MYYAVNSKNEVIATGVTMAECSQLAAVKTGYVGSPGSVAPYFITNHDWFNETCPMCSELWRDCKCEDENISK